MQKIIKYAPENINVVSGLCDNNDGVKVFVINADKVLKVVCENGAVFSGLDWDE